MLSLKNKAYWIPGLFLFVMVACSTSHSSLKPSREDVQLQANKGQQVTLESLTAGYKLYINHCSGCHNLHKPKSLDAAHWDEILPKMMVKAKLSEEEMALVRAYIHSKL